MDAILKTIIRLSGIVITVAALRGIIPYVVTLKTIGLTESFDRAAFAGQAVLVVIGVVLTMFPAMLGVGSLLSGADGGTAGAPPTAAQISSALTGIVGIYFLANALVNAAYYLAYWTQYRALAASTPAGFPAPADFVAGCWSTAAEFVVGAALLASAGRVSRMLARLREF